MSVCGGAARTDTKVSVCAHFPLLSATFRVETPAVRVPGFFRTGKL